MKSSNCTKLVFGATRRLLQSGWCFAALENCRFMHHGRRFHCATPVMVSLFLSGLPQAKQRHHDGVASSEQLPSREPIGLFDEKRVAPFFSPKRQAADGTASLRRWGRWGSRTAFTPPHSHIVLSVPKGAAA